MNSNRKANSIKSESHACKHCVKCNSVKVGLDSAGCGCATYAVVENELRLIDFGEEDELDEELGLYASFRDKRAGVSRNAALSRDEFLAYADDGYVDDVKAEGERVTFTLQPWQSMMIEAEVNEKEAKR